MTKETLLVSHKTNEGILSINDGGKTSLHIWWYCWKAKTFANVAKQVTNLGLFWKINSYLGAAFFHSGIHSCDNSSDYETPWKKRVAGQKVFSKIVNECKSSEKEKVVSSLIDLLSDKTQWVLYLNFSEKKEQITFCI